MDKSYFIEITIKLYNLTSFFPEQEPLRKKIREIANKILSNLVLILKKGQEKEIIKLQKLILLSERNFEVLDSYFEVAKVQDWTSSFDIFNIQKKYNNIKKEIEKLLEVISENETLLLPQTSSSTLNYFDLGIEKNILTTSIKKDESLDSITFSKNKKLGLYLSQSETFNKPKNQEIKLLKEQTGFKSLKEKPQNGSLYYILNRQIKILQILKQKQKVQTQELQKNCSEVTKRTIRRDLGFLLKQGLIERIGEKNKIFYQLNCKN